MKPTLSLLIAAFFFLSPAFSYGMPPRRESVGELMRVMKTDEVFTRVVQVISEKIKDSMLQQYFPNPVAPGSREEASRNEIKAEFDNYLKKVSDLENLHRDVYSIYQKYFSEEEIQDLIRFYQTPTGAKTLELAPTVMKEAMELSQARAQTLAQELKVKVEAIHKKYTGTTSR